MFGNSTNRMEIMEWQKSGFVFTNSFAMDTLSPGPAHFNINDGTPIGSIITRGRDINERVRHIAPFDGASI